MLIIRFQRVGRRNDPAYRMVVVEKRSRPKANGVETLGSYHPKTKQTVVHSERILYWIARGAQTSSTVERLLRKQGILKSQKNAGSAATPASDIKT